MPMFRLLMRFGKWKLCYTDTDKDEISHTTYALSSMHCIAVAAHICSQGGQALNLQQK